MATIRSRGDMALCALRACVCVSRKEERRTYHLIHFAFRVPCRVPNYCCQPYSICACVSGWRLWHKVQTLHVCVCLCVCRIAYATFRQQRLLVNRGREGGKMLRPLSSALTLDSEQWETDTRTVTTFDAIQSVNTV